MTQRSNLNMMNKVQSANFSSTGNSYFRHKLPGLFSVCIRSHGTMWATTVQCTIASCRYCIDLQRCCSRRGYFWRFRSRRREWSPCLWALHGWNVTMDNFFTNFPPATRLLERCVLVNEISCYYFEWQLPVADVVTRSVITRRTTQFAILRTIVP